MPKAIVLLPVNVASAPSATGLPKLILPVALIKPPEIVTVGVPPVAVVVNELNGVVPPTAPAKVRPPVLFVDAVRLAAPSMLPLIVTAPVLAINASAAKVMAPLTVAELALELYKAPLELIPVPERVNALPNEWAFRLIAAPLATVALPVPSAPLTKLPLLLTASTPIIKDPELILVPPL